MRYTHDVIIHGWITLDSEIKCSPWSPTVMIILRGFDDLRLKQRKCGCKKTQLGCHLLQLRRDRSPNGQCSVGLWNRVLEVRVALWPFRCIVSMAPYNRLKSKESRKISHCAEFEARPHTYALVIPHVHCHTDKWAITELTSFGTRQAWVGRLRFEQRNSRYVRDHCCFVEWSMPFRWTRDATCP